jgi:CRP-like cAMP-binding protein
MHQGRNAEKIIQTRGWLSQLPVEFQTAVLNRSFLKVYQPKEPVYHLGDEPGGIYGLISGGIAISVAPGRHGPYFAHFALPGFWFGEASVITGRPRRVGVVARRRTTLLHLPLPAIQELVAADPIVWRYLAANAVLSLDLAMTGYDDLMIRDPQTRVASILLRLAGYRTDLSQPGEEPQIDITHAELAEIAGLSRNSVGRALARLSEAGLIAFGYSQIGILKPRAMAHLIADSR